MSYKQDMANIPHHVSEVFDEVAIRPVKKICQNPRMVAVV